MELDIYLEFNNFVWRIIFDKKNTFLRKEKRWMK